MTEKNIIVQNKLGLHARPAALVVSEASRFRSEVYLNKDGIEVNAKSIMGLLMLAASMGSTIRVTTEGDDEKEAADAVEGLVTGKFYEE